ncbi:DUF1799 domain-containing protein [Halomonas caseinilytica]|uniref:DUF1799 domain-containing protein n=1 Tax=Halomonas caseinilytica TaxID=438744 RepID=UPI0007E56082
MRRSQYCEVWREHQVAYDVFLACSRQWRIVAGLAGTFHQGIDATALHSTMQMMGVQDMRTTLLQVQCIETGAKEKLNS